MHITFSPQRNGGALHLSRSGDTLTINGQQFDFSPLGEGATLPLDAIGSGHFAGPVERIDGELHIELVLPHGSNPPQHVAFPEPITVAADGPIGVPQ